MEKITEVLRQKRSCLRKLNRSLVSVDIIYGKVMTRTESYNGNPWKNKSYVKVVLIGVRLQT